MTQALAPVPATPAHFRRVASSYATGIAIVTTCHDGSHHAMTANSFTTVSLNPLLVSVCVQRGTRFHEAVVPAGSWAASFLTARQAELARWFATPGRPLADQFAGIPTLTGDNGALILAESLAAITATTVSKVAAGDHDILIAAVSGLMDRQVRPADSSPVSAGQPDPDDGPTVYFHSAYGSWLRGSQDQPNIKR
jgi:flavin reductase (DIM6/NTAB) family NADH-FMN oxidoreductase RutF